MSIRSANRARERFQLRRDCACGRIARLMRDTLGTCFAQDSPDSSPAASTIDGSIEKERRADYGFTSLCSDGQATIPQLEGTGHWRSARCATKSVQPAHATSFHQSILHEHDVCRWSIVQITVSGEEHHLQWLPRVSTLHEHVSERTPSKPRYLCSPAVVAAWRKATSSQECQRVGG